MVESGMLQVRALQDEWPRCAVWALWYTPGRG